MICSVPFCGGEGHQPFEHVVTVKETYCVTVHYAHSLQFFSAVNAAVAPSYGVSYLV